MVMTLRNTIICLLLILAIGSSAWTILLSKNAEPKRTLTDANLPDAFMEDITATIMTQEGTPSLKVTTPKMVHYASNDSTDIIKPVVIIYRRSPNPWSISSDYAKATDGTSQILFWQNVVLNHTADTDNPQTTMQTNTLTVFPNKRIAQTDQPITINQPDVTVHATGMTADMNDGTVKLLSKAQGEYVPVS